MAWQPVPLAGGHYTDNARPWANQEVVNWLPVKAERPGARSDLMLRDVPGLRPFSVVGNGPIRGAHNAEGTLFVVSGTGLYRISPLGVASSLGTIPGVGRVSMAHNQVTGGNQVVVANGSAAYVYNTADDSFAQITDEGFPGAKSVRFLGQMILYVEPFGRYWGSSDLADATSYNTIFRQEAEGSPDLILHVEPSQGEALVFGKRTIEVWNNTVTENANFQRTTVIERGAASQWAIVTLDNSCIFLGDDGNVYRLNGYTPVPISTRPLEFGLKDYDISKAFAFTWEDAGFKVVYFTIPGGLTWGYDVATGEWHRRESYGLDRWRLNCLAPFARKWIGGDFADGTLWHLDWAFPGREGCDEIVRICRPPMMHNGGNRVRVNGLRLEVDVGEAGESQSASITGALPDGYQGDVVSYQYTLSGYVEGDEVSAIAVTSGTLPDGLSISTTGLVTGTRTTAGTYSFTIAGTDRCGNTVTLSDTSDTIAPDLLTWIHDDSELNQSPTAVHVADGRIVIGCNNCALTYTDDEGADWQQISGTTNTGLSNAAAEIHGVVKFDGDWYLFQAASASKDTGGNLVFAALANQPSASERSPTVLNGSLYVGVYQNGGGGNVLLKKMVTPGAAWTSIDTGIANNGAADHVVGMCESDGAYLLITKGDSGVGAKVIRTTDFTTFTTTLTHAGEGTSMASQGGVVIACFAGEWYRSTDQGVTWSAAQSAPPFHYMGATPSMFMGSSPNGVYTAPLGITWTNRIGAPPGAYQGGVSATNTLAAAPIQSQVCTLGTP